MRKYLLAAALAAAAPAFAADLFTVDVTSGAQSAHVGFNNAEDAVDILKTANLAQQITYTGVEQALILINFRGLPIRLEYGAPGSTALLFSVPSIGINLVFNGVGGSTAAARDDAQDQLAEYLKGGDLLGQMMRELARVSPVDPTAGNPNSMQSRMVAQDFSSAFTSHASNIGAPPAPGQSTPNLVGIGLDFGQYQMGDFKSSSVTLPLSFTIRSTATPGHLLELRMPISAIDTEGATSYSGSVGFTWRYPVSKRWALAPSFNYAAAGSKELGSLATMASGSITSSYEMSLGSTTLAMGNMVGYYRSLKFKIEDYEYDPEIRNTVYRNGLMWSVPMSPSGNRIATEFSYINTQFTGTALYVRAQNEFGLTIGTAKGTSALSFVRVGVTYLYASNADGFSLNLGYWF